MGIFDWSVCFGVMKRKVCGATKLSLIVFSMRGIWQAVHWLPGLFSA